MNHSFQRTKSHELDTFFMNDSSEPFLIADEMIFNLDYQCFFLLFSIFSCFICDMSIKVKSYLRNHLKNHIIELLESPEFICDVCDKHFVSKSNLLYHKAEAHVKEKIKCDICSKTWVFSGKIAFFRNLNKWYHFNIQSICAYFVDWLTKLND